MKTAKADTEPKPEKTEKSKKVSKSSSKDFVLVKGCTWSMGEDKYKRTYTVDSFYMCRHEVTQAEYKAVMQENPSYHKWNDNFPVECVSWYDAVNYCNIRSKKEGLVPCYFKSGDDYECNFTANGYRLPTEIEWFYAAIGGKMEKDDNGDIRHSEYSGSNDIDSVAWYRENSNGEPHEVMSKKPNELGLYDMSGNVFEWVWDPGRNGGRYFRGGSCCNYADCCGVLDSFSDSAGSRRRDVGFRIVRPIK